MATKRAMLPEDEALNTWLPKAEAIIPALHSSAQAWRRTFQTRTDPPESNIEVESINALEALPDKDR